MTSAADCRNKSGIALGIRAAHVVVVGENVRAAGDIEDLLVAARDPVSRACR
jgi:hypothetical protein